jgi:rubrerythrin
MRKKTHEEFVREVEEKYPNKFTILEKYKGNKIKILVKCNKCGYEWKITPNKLLQDRGCPKCAGNTKKNTKRSN